MLKNYKDLKVFRKQTLESLTPGTLGPSSPTKLEKNHIYLLKLIKSLETRATAKLILLGLF